MSSDGLEGHVYSSGTGSATEAAQNTTIIAAPGADKHLRIMKGFISITLAATGGGGLASLEDGAGGTKIDNIPASVLGAWPFDFGPKGYPLTDATLLNLTVDAATTNEATAFVTVTAYEVS